MRKTSVLELKQPDGSVLFDLSAFSTGPEGVLERISSQQPGIYAWFRSFNFSQDPEAFATELIAAIESPKFQARTGTLAPYYEVNLRSKSSMPESKQKALRNALTDADFSSSLRFSLEWAMLLQAPLYVGKSIDLKLRIKQHLRSGSSLRERLADVHIAIDQCHLLIIPVPTKVDLVPIAEIEQEDNEEMNLSHELLFEEVFSRLFNPAFTIRLG